MHQDLSKSQWANMMHKAKKTRDQASFVNHYVIAICNRSAFNHNGTPMSTFRVMYRRTLYIYIHYMNSLSFTVCISVYLTKLA